MKENSVSQISLSALRRFTLLLFFASVLQVCSGRPSYEPKPLPKYESFESYFQAKIAESKAKNHRPGNEERYISFGKRTPIAFLYIHGFGASRAEGEAVMEILAKKFKANTYLLRLPGHGTNKEDQAAQSFSDYLDASREALEMMQSQGDRVILFGSSMGGLLCTWLAAEYPNQVSGIVLANPFYAPVDSSLNILNYPGGLTFIHLLKGRVRSTTKQNDPNVLPERNDYWYPEQYFSALVGVNDLKNYAAIPTVYQKVNVPTLLLYYYKNEKEQDPTASVPAMLNAYSQFAETKTNPKSRKVAIENGRHVLMSKYIITDKALIEKETSTWLTEVSKSK
ncbi:alpha/beta hydrolase [Leptospira ryugenii]|nr:alpha/beta hydrolase [Leptospira ryugenii]